MKRKHAPAGESLSELFLAVFRLNGELLRWGDKLIKPLGTTSARWQVLGAIALEPQRQTVSDIARKMGLTRQSVLHVVNELQATGYLALAPNPAHKRAHHVTLTPEGARLYAQIMDLYVPHANELSVTLRPGAVRKATAVLRNTLTALEEHT